MKLRLLTFIFLISILSPLHLIAVNTTEVDHLKNKTHPLTDISVGQFIALDFEKLQESKLIKINWIQKSIFKAAQKKLTKKVNKGKINASQSLFKAGAGKSENRRGMFSLIFGGAGFLFLFLGPLAYLSLPLGIAGLILGIIGVKKDKDDTMAIIGMVFGSLVILLFILAIILIASFFI